MMRERFGLSGRPVRELIAQRLGGATAQRLAATLQQIS